VSADYVLLYQLTVNALGKITTVKLKGESLDINEPDEMDVDVVDEDLQDYNLTLGKKATVLMIIHYFPTDAQVIPPAIQKIQKKYFSAIEKVRRQYKAEEAYDIALLFFDSHYYDISRQSRSSRHLKVPGFHHFVTNKRFETEPQNVPCRLVAGGGGNDWL
jgi:hypothetical protein